MARRANVLFSSLVVGVIVTVVLIGDSMWFTPSWNIGHWVSITETQNEIFWTLPGDSSSQLHSSDPDIEVYIDLVKFRQKVKEQNKQCNKLTADPVALFKSRPSNTTQFTADMDRYQIVLAYLCGGVLQEDFLKAKPKEELYPFEAFYLSDPPLWDESTVACHKHSNIRLTRSDFIVGDTVALVVTMFDKLGRPRLKGGDRIQVWLKDMKFNHSISTKITDFNNGTYLASTVLPWAGTVRVMATLRQPREYFRALAYVHRALKSTMPFIGAYANSKASEGVPCSPYPIVPGFLNSELCNLTSVNGSPWFCGRPTKPQLNCSDYQFASFSKTLFDMPVTPAETTLLKQRVNQHNFLTGDINFNVNATQGGITRLKDPDVPCNKVSPRSTWHQAVPSGYFYNKVWKSFMCYTPEKPEQVDESCFRNVNAILYGDSNSREFYYSITSKTRCHGAVLGKGENYHAPKICENKTRNFSVQHISHQSPFHLGATQFLNSSWLHSPERLLGSIPSEVNYILSFNHYLHFTAHHISVYERALKAVRDAIMKLWQRNPKVLVILRGPHVAERPSFTYYMGDAWAQYLTTIQRETFKDLQDNVLYFPTWDITVASEDTGIHPTCNNHISHLMLHFLCGRHK